MNINYLSCNTLYTITNNIINFLNVDCLMDSTNIAQHYSPQFTKMHLGILVHLYGDTAMAGTWLSHRFDNCPNISC